jgi:hypothetical protein
MQYKKVTVLIQIIYIAQLIGGVFRNHKLRQPIEKKELVVMWSLALFYKEILT